MDLDLYDLYNEDTEDFLSLTRQQLLDKGLNKGHVSDMLNKNRRSVQGYILLETYSNEQVLVDSTIFYLDKRDLVEAYSVYLTEEQRDIILNNNDQWLTALTITQKLGPILRAYCPRC